MAFLGDQVPPHSVVPVEYFSTTDPNGDVNNHVAAGKQWLKTDSLSTPTWFELYRRNQANGAWILLRAWTNTTLTQGDLFVADANGRMAPLALGGSGTAPVSNGTTLVYTTIATQAYVDGAIAGLSWKETVRVATTVAGTLASSFENGDTVDGVTLATGDRILIKNQASDVENGIYTVNASGAPTRATDADSQADILQAAMFVQAGTTNADTCWVLTTNAPITLGVTSLTFVQFGAGGITGSGTATKLPKFTSSTVLGDSAVTENTSDLTSTKALILPASTTSIASVQLPHGSAPTTPTNGEVWTTTAGIFVRVNGSTVGPLSATSGTITGSGTTNKIPKWTGSSALGDGAATENTNDWTFTKGLILPASTTTIASLNAPHGSAPTSPADGDIWTTTAGIFIRVNGSTIGPLVATGGGGGLAQAYVGYNTVGGSNESMVGRRWYLKKVTIAADCLMTDIQAYIDAGGGVDQVDSMAAALFTDSSGSPLTLLSYCPSPSSSLLPDSVTGAGGDTTGRWHGRPIGRWVTAADYWICVGCPELTVGSMRIFYDSSGSDKHFAAGGDWITDAGFTTVSDNSKHYSIRANTIR